MPIQYKVGNLRDAAEMVIVHGCNAQGVMGSGVARMIRDDYPEAYEVYVATHKREPLRTGQVVWAPSRGKLIANAITQRFYGGDPASQPDGRYVSYAAISGTFDYIRRICQTLNITSIAFPKIGAGLGGGKWEEIEPLIEEALERYPEVAGPAVQGVCYVPE